MVLCIQRCVKGYELLYKYFCLKLWIFKCWWVGIHATVIQGFSKYNGFLHEGQWLKQHVQVTTTSSGQYSWPMVGPNKKVCVCKKLAKVPAPNLNWPFVCVISVCGSSSILPFKMKRPPFPRLDATWTDEIRGEEPPLPPAPTSAESSCWTVRCNVHNFLHVENPATIPKQFSCGPGKHMLGAPDVSLPYGISAFLMRNHRTSSIKMGSGILICNVRLLTFAELHTRATARFCAPNLVRGGSWISNAAGGFVFFYSLKAWVCACVCVWKWNAAQMCTWLYRYIS